MAKYRVARLGFGGRGKAHAAAFFKHADRFQVVAMCELDEEKAGAFSGQYGIDHIYSDAEEMLAKEKPEVFSFSTQPTVRLPLVELAVRQGVKAINFEKPMAISLEEGRRIEKTCREAGLKAIVSHQGRFSSRYLGVKQIVESGDLGPIYAVYGHDLGHPIANGTHLMDYMIGLNGDSPPTWVMGQIHGRKLLEAESHPSPDYVTGLMGFENGVRGIYECGELSVPVPGEKNFWFNGGIKVIGQNGFAELFTGIGWRAVTAKDGLIEGGGPWDPELDQPPYVAALADWLDDDAQVHPNNVTTAYRGHEALMAIYLSSLERRKVDLPLEAGDVNIEMLRREMPGN